MVGLLLNENEVARGLAKNGFRPRVRSLDLRPQLLASAQSLFAAEPEAVQQAVNRRAVDDDPTRLQIDAQCVQRQVPGLRHASAHEVDVRCQLARARRMTLPARLQGADLNAA